MTAVRSALSFKCLTLALLLLLAAAHPALAQTWPPKTVRIVVPFGAGSTPDIVARIVADGLSRKYPKSAFVVENKPGASGNIGTDAVAKAAPDGGTIGVSIGGPLAINTLLFSKLPYDPKKDITAVTQLITQPSALAINPDLKAKIADVYREAAIPYLRESRATAPEGGDGQDRRVFDSAMYLAENLERAPAFVISCIAEDLGKMDALGATVTLGSIVQAGWSFQLALRARGHGSTWTTLHLRNAQAVADLLGIPAGITQVSLIPVAYTKGLDFKPAKRPPVEEITHWDHWTESFD